MKDRTPKLCPNCGKDHIRRIARAGRAYEYKGFSYEIPAAMALKECPACHEMPMSVEEVEAVEAAVGAVHQQKLTAAVEGYVKVLETKMPIGVIEKYLKVSQGYLARVRSKRSEPSFQLVALLGLLAKSPDELPKLESMV